LIRHTYEQAVANGLDIPSKPGTDEDAWVQRRFQLDRQATEAVKQFLTPEEQSSFDRAFLGLMGADKVIWGCDRSCIKCGNLNFPIEPISAVFGVRIWVLIECGQFADLPS